MNNLLISIASDDQTPLVDFKITGELKIEGKSYPEDPMKFFGPILDWLKELKKSPPPKILLTVQLDYFNTSTSKLVLVIFKLLESIHLYGKSEVKIIWFYHNHDEDMTESGKDYKSLVDVPFELVEL